MISTVPETYQEKLESHSAYDFDEISIQNAIKSPYAKSYIPFCKYDDSIKNEVEPSSLRINFYFAVNEFLIKTNLEENYINSEQDWLNEKIISLNEAMNLADKVLEKAERNRLELIAREALISSAWEDEK